MKTCVVTGAAGFIGSHLCEALLTEGWAVRGIDAFIPYYPESWKRRNLLGLVGNPGFALHTLDLRHADVRPVLDGAETVIHLAAMPGLRRSWSEFDLYASCNLNATQRLLEAADAAGIRHFIHGSTSSVYGAEAAGAESSPLRPVSPYGVTKLAAEHLCRAYQDIRGLPLTVLRFFSVYGPRQRPDMAYTILIDALLNGKPFPRYGDGTQTRSNTFVADCVQGIALTARHRDQAVGQTWNLGGGEVVSLNEVIAVLESLTGRHANIETHPAVPGDQQHTAADISAIRHALGYQPATRVPAGLAAQVDWYKDLLP
jgi:nucleoside-diphosphate-sugar epimerase